MVIDREYTSVGLVRNAGRIIKIEMEIIVLVVVAPNKGW